MSDSRVCIVRVNHSLSVYCVFETLMIILYVVFHAAMCPRKFLFCHYTRECFRSCLFWHYQRSVIHYYLSSDLVLITDVILVEVISIFCLAN